MEGRSYDGVYVPAPILQSLVADPRRRFGDRLRALRRQAGLTQQALGAAAGLDSKTISRVEGGVYSPTLDRVFLIAAALGRPPVDLFAWSESTGAAAQPVEPPAPGGQ
jgi:transcriptional regulator with XRE-family HTH domain